jgi:predicted DNA-binding transcriptional regulator AlpA
MEENRFLRRDQVARLLGLRRQTINLLMARGMLPEPIYVDRNDFGWTLRQIEPYLQGREAGADDVEIARRVAAANAPRTPNGHTKGENDLLERLMAAFLKETGGRGPDWWPDDDKKLRRRRARDRLIRRKRMH